MFRRPAERLQEQGEEPDVRFTYANERTFLAWNRTALALVATGIAATQLLPRFSDFPAGRRVIGLPLIALGAFLALVSYRQWYLNQRAMRRGNPLPPSNLTLILASGIGIMSFVAIAVVLIGE